MNKKSLGIITTIMTILLINQSSLSAEPPIGRQYNEELTRTYTELATSISTTTPKCECAKKKAEKDAEYAKGLGYSEEDLELARKLRLVVCLGCGNPVSVVDLKEGEIGVDLGSGGGFDAFKAGKIVGSTGRVIGIDSNEKMIETATRTIELARREGITNVEFIRGELEKLPLPDNYATAAWSNCVFNLANDKQQAIMEVFRVLQPGGRFIFSDVVSLGEMTESMKKDIAMQTFCIARATPIDDLRGMLEMVGFKNVKIQAKDSGAYLEHWTSGTEFEEEAFKKVRSAYIYAYKPARK